MWHQLEDLFSLAASLYALRHHYVRAGIVEADEVFTPESLKGSRHLKRPVRHHGGKGHGHVPLVPTLIALDRYGRESDTVLLDKSLNAIKLALQPLQVPGSILKATS